jgi:GNAT superfamily N-acetyltransferase
MTYIFKKVSIRDIEDIATVFNNTRGTNRPARYFLDKFQTPSEKEYMGVVAYDEKGNPVCHTAMIPLPFIYKGEKILAAVSGDTVTIPAHQRKGLFKEASLKLLDYAREDGVQLIFRIPNPTTFQGLMNHLDYHHIGDFYGFTISVKPYFPIIKFFNRFKLLKLRNFYVRLFLEIFRKHKAEKFENSIIRQGFSGIPHDDKFYNYKNYSENYLLGIGMNKFWFKIDDGIVIGDMELNDSENFITQLKSFCKKIGFHKMTFFAMEGTEEYRILSKTIEPKKGLPVCIHNTAGTKYDLTQIRFSFADHDSF